MFCKDRTIQSKKYHPNLDRQFAQKALVSMLYANLGLYDSRSLPFPVTFDSESKYLLDMFVCFFSGHHFQKVSKQIEHLFQKLFFAIRRRNNKILFTWARYEPGWGNVIEITHN